MSMIWRLILWLPLHYTLMTGQGKPTLVNACKQINFYYKLYRFIDETRVEVKMISVLIGGTIDFECGPVNTELEYTPVPYLFINGTYYHMTNLDHDTIFSIVNNFYSFSLRNVPLWKNNTKYCCFFPRLKILTIPTILQVIFRKFTKDFLWMIINHVILCLSNDTFSCTIKYKFYILTVLLTASSCKYSLTPS